MSVFKRRRGLAIAGGATVAGGAAIAGALLGLDKLGPSGQSPDTGPKPGTTPTFVDPTPSPTIETPTATKTPEATPTPDNSPATHGKYLSIESLPFSSQRKENIRQLTVDCEPMIITDEGMVCIEKALMTRPEKITHNGSVINVSQLYSIGLDIKTYPDASQRFDNFLLQGKFEAWKNQSRNSSVSFEDFMASRGSNSHPFTTWAYQGTTDSKGFPKLNDDTYIVMKFVAASERTNILSNQGLEFANETLGDVLAGSIFTDDPGGVGKVDTFGTQYQNYEIGYWMMGYLLTLGADIPPSILGGKLPVSAGQPLLQISLPKIAKQAIPQYNSTSTAGFKSIFSVTGSILQK
jgi:hypothetical protein